MPITTDTHDYEVEVRHVEDRHAMEVYVTRKGDVGNMIDSYGGWSAIELPLAVLPCAVWNLLYDQMQEDVLLAIGKMFFGEPQA